MLPTLAFEMESEERYEPAKLVPGFQRSDLQWKTADFATQWEEEKVRPPQDTC